MSGLRALAYADLRSLVNGIAAIARRPWRALLWTLWIAAIITFGWLRTARPAPPSRPVLGELVLDDLWICIAAIAFGIVLACGAPHLTGFFSSRAEALMLVRAPLPPSLVAAYLQARTAGLTLLQGFGRFAYVILLVIPVHTGPLGLAREMLLLAALTLAIVSIPLPRALARGTWRSICMLAGSAIVMLAVLPLARDGLLLLVRTPAAYALALRLPPWHPGTVFETVARGDLLPVLWAIVVALAASLIFTVSARDMYPELFALSMARLEHRARLRGRARAQVIGGAPRARSASRVPAPLHGALALVWLETKTWSRSSSPVMTALLVAIALAVGTGLALLLRTRHPNLATMTIFGVLTNLTVAFASAAGVRLAADLRRPLFWLGSARLAARLGAWTYASFWRDAILVLVMGAAYVTLAHEWPAGLALVLVTLGVLILTRAVGVAVFALLPNVLDQRGPAVGLRLLVAYALVVPPILPALIVGLVTRAVTAGACVGLLAAVCESTLLLGFASWRLGGRVDRLTA